MAKLYHHPDQITIWQLLGEEPVEMKAPARPTSLPIAEPELEPEDPVRAAIAASLPVDAVLRAHYGDVIAPVSDLTLKRRQKKREREDAAAAAWHEPTFQDCADVHAAIGAILPIPCPHMRMASSP